MSKLITRIKRLALALCLATPIVSWAGLPTVTVNGNDVTISFDSGKYGNIGTNNGGTDTITIPAATDLDSGTVLLIKSISLGSRDSGTASPASITVAGVNSDVAVVTDDVYGTNRDKYTYNFSSPCLVKVGTASSVSYKNANGEQVNVGLAAALITEAPDSYVFGLNSYSFNQTHTWGILFEIVAEKVTGYINETANGFNTTVTGDKVYLSGVDGYLNTIDAFGFGTVDELVVVDGEYTYGYKVVNGNSPQNNEAKRNRAVAFKKLSGTGTITNGDHVNGPTPVMGVCDSSEFAGSINIGSATTRLSVLFCTEAEISAGIQTSLGDSLFNLFAGTSTRSRIYVSAGRTTANNAVVTVPAGKTWTAVNGIVNKGELVVDGTVSCNIVNDGTLTVNGTVTGTISGSGTVVVNEGATLASFGSQRDFTGWTIHASDAAKITMSAEEYGKGSVSVTGASGISTITVLAPDGTTTVGTITPAESSTLETGVKTSGLATWCDYEFNGNKSNSGVNTAALSGDTIPDGTPEFFNNAMLYTYTHPYRGITYPNSWTAVVRCTVPELENAVVVTFGTYSAGAIGLIAGSNPEEEMLLVSTPGSVEQAEDKHFTTLATMNVKDATTAQHVYVFTKDGTTVNVYCDGEKVLENYELASATLGGGLQIGSLHGGVVQSGVHTGLVRFGAGEDQISSLSVAQQQNARIDCMRMFDYIVSPEQIAALSVEFPAVKLFRATVADGATTDWDLLTWSPKWDGGNTQSKVILTTEGDAVVALPASITVDEVQLDLAEGSTLTLTGPGELAITQPITIEDGTLELTGTVTLTQNTAFNGAVTFTEFTKDGDGAIQLSNGATVGVDAELVVTPLGTYTCAEGTVVDSAYTGDGVIKLIPLTSAVVSIKQGTTTLYYSDLDTALGPLVNAPGTISDDVVVTLLNGTTLPFGYDTFLLTAGYYIDGDVITKAVARIGTTTYPTLAAAVGAATDGATVTLLLASNEEITLSDKAITLDETANFSGTLTGNGTLTFKAFRNNPDITFDNWEGTIVLPEFAANGTILNKYGVTGSKVVLKGITAGWLGETGTQTMDVNPVLQLDGDVTIKGFSTSWDYTFAEITGTGTFSLDPTDNHPKSATITKVAEDFSGIITNNTDKVLTITTLAREAGTSTDVGTKLLDIGGTGEIVVGAVTIGGEPADVYLVYEEDGVYVGVPPVAAVYDGETLVGNFASLADAIDAAEAGQKVVLLAATAEDVTVNKVVVVEAGDYAITGTITVTADGATVTLLNEPTLGANTWILGRDTVTGVITVGYGLTCELVIVCSGLGDVTPTTPTGIGVREGTANTWEVRGGTEVTLTATPGTDYSGYEYRVDGGSYTVMGDSEQYNLVFVNNVATITVNGYTHASVTFVVREQEFTIPASAHMVVDRVYKSGEFETVYEPDPETGKYSITQGTTIVVRYTPIEGYIVMPDGYYEYDLEVTAETTTVDNTSAEAAATKVVAKIDETPYTSLVEAVIAATDGDTVTLVADVAENVTIASGKTVTLDLAGYTLNGGTVAQNAAIANFGTLTIVDSSSTGVIKREDTAPTGAWYVIDNSGVLTVSGGTITNASGDSTTHRGASLIRTNVGGSTTIAGGTLTQDAFNVLKDEGNCTINITGGTLECANAEYAILTYGTLTVSGGSITGPVDIRGYKDSTEDVTGTATISGGTFDGALYVEQYTGYPSSGTPSLTITGGTFNNVSINVGRGTKTSTFVADPTAGTVAISGGLFSAPVAEAHCAAGYIPCEVTGGYSVKVGAYVAQIGTTKYETLAEAVAQGGEVTLLADVAENVTIASGKTVTLDLAGYTLNGGTVAQKAAIANLGTLTIVDTSSTGVIKREDTAPTGAWYVIDNSGVLTVSGGTITNASGDSTTHRGASLIRTNVGGSTTIAGGTLTQDAFNVLKDEGNCTINITGGTLECANAEYAILTYGTLTVSGGSITGPVDIRGYKDSTEDVTGTATISGGTFDGALYVEQYTGYPASANPSLTITGGTFNNVSINVGRGTKTSTFVADSTAGTVAISGGTFSSDVKAYCVTGKTTEKQGNVYVIVDAPSGIDPTDPTSTQEVTPTAEEIEAAGSAEAAAIAKAEVTAPTGVDAAQYKENFELRAEPNGDGSYTVTIVGFDPQMETDVAESAAEALEEESPTVEVPAGLYYKIETLSALNGTDEDPKTGMSNGTAIPVTKPTGTTQGFIRVRIGTAEITD